VRAKARNSIEMTLRGHKSPLFHDDLNERVFLEQNFGRAAL
jgi:hypothetical protein